MKELSFHGLQPDIFFGQEWFTDLADSYAKVLNDNIRYPAYQLENLRSVEMLNDPVVSKQTLMQYGFDLPLDFIAHNYQNLVGALPYLQRYAERSGTKDYTRLMSFVLGRDVTATPLYSADYESFYTKPHGALQVEGGDWYKTTHVELGMQLVPGDTHLKIPRNTKLRDRFLSAFYEFAPWSVVVNEFYFKISVKADLYLSGCVFKHPKRYISVGDSIYKLTELRIDGPINVSEQTSEQYNAMGIYTSGAEGNRTPRKPVLAKARFVNGVLQVFDEQVLEYGEQVIELTLGAGEYGVLYTPQQSVSATFTDLGTNLEGAWDGASWPQDDVGTEMGPVVVQRTQAGVTSNWLMYRTDWDDLGSIAFNVRFEVNYQYDDVGPSEYYERFELPLYTGDWRSSRAGLTTIEGGSIHFGAVARNTDVTVHFSHGGLTTSKTISVRNDMGRIRALRIEGDSSLDAGSTAHYHVIAETLDGDEPYEAEITVLSHQCIIEGNVLTAFELDSNVYVDLRVESRGLVATKPVLLQYVDFGLHVTGLAITAPLTVDEQKQIPVSCTATFSDGTSRKVIAAWSTNCGSVHVSSDGTLTSGLTEGDIPVRLTATYQHKDKQTTTTHDMKLIKQVMDVVKVEVVGDHRVVANTKTRYSALATLTDGRKVFVDADWSSTRYEFDESGSLSVGSVGPDPISFSVRASVMGMTASKNIVAVETPVTLRSISIEGPDNVREGFTTIYNCFAHFSNGQQVRVQPEWSLRTAVSWATIDQEGRFNVDAPREGIVEIVATYRVGERVFVKGRPVVVVPKSRIIRGLFINGPTEVMEGQRVVLTATAVYSDGTTATVKPIWDVESIDPLNIPHIAADIVSPGVLQGRWVEKDTYVLVVARYFQEIADFKLLIKTEQYLSPDIPETSRIIGPTVIEASDDGSYAHAIRFAHCEEEDLVSSTWSLDVESDVATISSAGFLRSVNGRSTTVVVTSVYECGNRTVVDSIVVRIQGSEDVMESLTIEGPSTLKGSPITQYRALLFVKGGDSRYVTPEWSITPADGRVSVDTEGNVKVFDNSAEFSFRLKAKFTEGFESVEAQKDVRVLPPEPDEDIDIAGFGIGPIGIRSDSEISKYATNQLEENRTQLISLHTEPGEFMYVCYPVEWGLATFKDPATDFVGGWDGASWPDDGDVGEEFGPIIIQRTYKGVTSDWYLYRTDFDGLGSFTFEVSFGG